MAKDWRNRVKGLEYHKPGEIADHPYQWRTHPREQAAALRGILDKVGIAGLGITNGILTARYRHGSGGLGMYTQKAGILTACPSLNRE